VTLLRQESIHPSYQTEKKQVRKPSTEDKATGELHEAKGTIKEKVGKYQGPERKLTTKRKKMPAKLKTR
jgi:uncharacterized protein YjbJ (UPF0337 family)